MLLLDPRLVLLDDALSLDPELVLVAFYDGNDFFDAWNERRRFADLATPDSALLAELKRSG